MIEKILAAIDGSEHAWKALDLAADLAQQHGAQLIVLHVVRFEPLPDALRAFAEAERLSVEEEEGRYRYARSLGDRLTRAAEARARDKGVSDVVGRTLDGKPAEQILELAGREGVDMIVMGSRGLSDAKAFFLGSVSHQVANNAICTCVTVK
jgi:nucleotide-binding universal stress UspA family protein